MKRALPLLVVLLLSACTTLPSPGCILIDRHGYYCLQPTKAVKPFAALQEVTFKGPQAGERVLVMLEVDAQNLRVAVLSSLGHKLMELHYDNHKVDAVQPAGRPERFSPELAVALIQLTLWPAPAVRNGLSPSFIITERNGRRQIATDTRTLLSARYDGAAPPYRKIEIDWFIANVTVQVRTLSASAP